MAKLNFIVGGTLGSGTLPLLLDPFSDLVKNKTRLRDSASFLQSLYPKIGHHRAYAPELS